MEKGQDNATLTEEGREQRVIIIIIVIIIIGIVIIIAMIIITIVIVTIIQKAKIMPYSLRGIRV